MPDLRRVVRPLASYGFIADNDGRIYNVIGPFDAKADSPAWNAGIREGDRLDLSRLQCFPYDATTCGNALAMLGGHQYVLPGRPATLDLLPTVDRPARQVTLVAKPQPANPFERFVVALDQVAGIMVVLAAAWLVWTRPGPMSWGFLLYVNWFNPGQIYSFYERRRRQRLEDYQRLRWVIWGCLIGLPSFIIAELGSTTTIFNTRWGNFTPSEDILGLLYLVNGILCLFVFEAIRRERVVSVAIPLRRITILGLPALLLHHEVEYMQ